MNDKKKTIDIQTLNVKMENGADFNISGEASTDGMLRMVTAIVRHIHEFNGVPIEETLLFILTNAYDDPEE